MDLKTIFIVVVMVVVIAFALLQVPELLGFGEAAEELMNVSPLNCAVVSNYVSGGEHKIKVMYQNQSDRKLTNIESTFVKGSQTRKSVIPFILAQGILTEEIDFVSGSETITMTTNDPNASSCNIDIPAP